MVTLVNSEDIDETLHAPCHLGLHWAELQLNVHYMYLEIMTCDPLNHIMDDPILNV